MARFLIATLPLAGHVGPGLPIARTLVLLATGHAMTIRSVAVSR